MTNYFSEADNHKCKNGIQRCQNRGYFTQEKPTCSNKTANIAAETHLNAMRNTLNYESKDILLRPKRAHISSQKVACVTTIAHNTLAYN